MASVGAGCQTPRMADRPRQRREPGSFRPTNGPRREGQGGEDHDRAGHPGREDPARDPADRARADTAVPAETDRLGRADLAVRIDERARPDRGVRAIRDFVARVDTAAGLAAGFGRPVARVVPVLAPGPGGPGPGYGGSAPGSPADRPFDRRPSGPDAGTGRRGFGWRGDDDQGGFSGPPADRPFRRPPPRRDAPASPRPFQGQRPPPFRAPGGVDPSGDGGRSGGRTAAISKDRRSVSGSARRPVPVVLLVVGSDPRRLGAAPIGRGSAIAARWSGRRIAAWLSMVPRSSPSARTRSWSRAVDPWRRPSLPAGPRIRLLVVPQRRHALEQLVLHATRLRIPIVEVEGGSLTAVAGFDGHQGIALVVEPRRLATLDDVLARALERGEPPFVLVLDSLEDPQNLGTLLRSAEAAGVHGVLFPTRRQAPLTPSAIKASAGAVEHLLLCPVEDLAGALADLHARGLRVAGAEADAPMTARQTDLRGPLALVVGSEGQGLGPAVRRRCDTLMRIPMRGVVGSLNAAVAGSILLFEAVAQRDPEGAGAPPRSASEDSGGFVAAPQERREAAAAALETVAPDIAEDALPPDATEVPFEDASPPAADAAVAPEAPETPDETRTEDGAPGPGPEAPAKPRRTRTPKVTASATAPGAEPAEPAPARPRRTRTPKVTASPTAPPEAEHADSAAPSPKPRRARASRAVTALSEAPEKVGDAPADPDAEDLLPGGPPADAGDPPARPARRRGPRRA